MLENANDTHKATLKVNSQAQEKLDKKSDEIRENTSNKIEQIKEELNKDTEDLMVEKEKFVNEQKQSSDLAKDLANAIGADFVDSDDS